MGEWTERALFANKRSQRAQITKHEMYELSPMCYYCNSSLMVEGNNRPQKSPGVINSPQKILVYIYIYIYILGIATKMSEL